MFPLSILLAAAASAPSAASASVTHYPPNATNLNNLDAVLNGTGAPGIFNSSHTPDEIYGIYNWCNMPHVRKREYKVPPKEYKLKYVEVIQRHHKRTPYASNTFFKEDVEWDCSDGLTFHGVNSNRDRSTEIDWEGYTNTQNPWTTSIGPGFVGTNCQLPQISSEGWQDSRTHGADLRELYGPLLSLPAKFDPSIARVRVTNNVITSQVGSGLISGLFPKSTKLNALIQANGIDSLEPQYPCPKADSLKKAFMGNNANWTEHLTAAKDLFAKLDSVSGIDADDTAGWHVSFDHYYDNMSAKQCHGKPLPCSVNNTQLCVTQDEANTVYRLGSYEYSYLWRDAPDSALYSALHYGAWFLELKDNLEKVVAGKNQIRYMHNIAHDGSVSPVLGLLQVDTMFWPGMGSEIVFELYEKSSDWFIRVLWLGQPLSTSTPLGTLDMVPLQDFLGYLEDMIGTGSDLYSACNPA